MERASFPEGFFDREHLTVLGMNAAELATNPGADATVLHDLNANPRLRFPADSFDAVVCCVSVDYLTRPVEVFEDVARVIRPAGRSCARSRMSTTDWGYLANHRRAAHAVAPIGWRCRNSAIARATGVGLVMCSEWSASGIVAISA